MDTHHDFTKGPIFGPLIAFVLPVLAALLLQSTYGAVDLLIVGKFALAEDISAVSTGSQIMMTLTGLIVALSMGTTIALGEKIGEGKPEEGGKIVGASLFLFALLGLILTVFVPLLAPFLARLLQAPEEAFTRSAAYIRICGIGFLPIIAYNLIGSVFRGLGDSRTPLVTVLLACVANIGGDLLLVAGFHMGAAGAAAATIFAQALSVLFSLIFIRRKKLPFAFKMTDIRWNSGIMSRVLKLGAPIALQDLLVGISFLVILGIVNGLGLTASAGVGVAERVCGFIMLVPSAFMQAMSAFVAQNRGAGRMDRAYLSLRYSLVVSIAFGVLMFYVNFFHGSVLARIFTDEPQLIDAAADYLKAYAIDCLLTAFLFCFIGFFIGMGSTRFVMMQ